MMIDDLTVAHLTEAINDNSSVTGNGVYDVLMNAVRAHVYEEYEQGRLTGQEYAEVYLGATQSAMSMALEFLLKKDLLPLEAENLRLQGENLVKQGQLVDAQIIKVTKEGELLDKQHDKVEAEVDHLRADIVLINRRADNEIKQGNVLDETVCKLKAEFDLLMAQVEKVGADTGLISQKKLTEAAQINGSGVDADSVIGRQKGLYVAQTEGFYRDAEQKAAKMFVDAVNVRQGTDPEGVVHANAGLGDSQVAAVLQKLKEGINIGG